MNKRGDVQSIVIIVVVMFAILFIVLIGAKFFMNMGDKLQTSSVLDSDSKENVAFLQSKFIPMLDNFIFYIFWGLVIALIISSIFIDVHPAFTIVFLLLLFVVVYLSGLLTDIFARFSSAPALVSTASQFTKTNLIFGSWFPTIILFVGVIAIVIIYGKGRLKNYEM